MELIGLNGGYSLCVSVCPLKQEVEQTRLARISVLIGRLLRLEFQIIINQFQQKLLKTLNI